MISLRPYQEKIISDTRRALHHHKKVMLQLPTGAGKTVCATFMMEGAAKKGLRSWFVVHRRELVDQTGRTLEKMNLDHGFCATGFPYKYDRPITVCSVQTLARRMERMPEPGMIIWDEAHHAAAGTWKKVADRFPKAYHLGLSATPTRLDGQGLDSLFSALVPGPSVSWLIEEGFLSPFRVWTTQRPDLSDIKMRGADYDQGALGKVMGSRAIVGDAVKHYTQICPGQQAVAFCCNVEHAYQTRDAFREAGIIAEELDGTVDGATRKRMIKAFRAGEIHVLTSVDLFGEGFDLPELAAVILLRPTKSLSLHLQQCGRALRTSPGKEMAYILDHAGNIVEHGPPDMDREWTLASKKKRSSSGKNPAKLCENCFASVPVAAALCPYCQSVFDGRERDVKQVDGELVELDLVALRKRRVVEEAQAQTYDELKALERERGYRPGWAKFRWDARQKKRAL